ncbi:MAG TPA: CoA-binding protein [Methanomassiliicoccales archaeon]|nr:CoA-binding protein [Methanomassiliicoccales archaeon]
MPASLERLFNPKSVAVVGASSQPEKAGNVILRQLIGGTFRIYPVNPNRHDLLGLLCYPSVSALPEKVDVAILSVAAAATLQAVRECVLAKIPFVISVAGGFSEMGEEGRAAQQLIAEAVKGTETRLLGPNTMGVMVPGHRFDTFFLPRERSPRPKDGSVSIISQSGSVLVGLYEMAEDHGVGLRSCVGVGNKADLDENDFLEYLAHEHGTKCIGMYIESFARGADFFDLAKEVSRKKPIVAVKVGTTPSGARAAASHTGAIATSSDSLVSGVFKQAGVLRVADDFELLDATKALAHIGHIKGDRIAIVGSAGGFGVIATDYISSKSKGFGLTMASIDAETRAKLREKVPSFASVENPIDLTGVVTDQMYHEVIELMQGEDSVDAILLNLLFQPPGMTVGVVDVVERWARKGRKPMVVCCVGGSFPRPILRRLEEKGVPTYGTPRRAAFALRCLYERGMYLRRLKEQGED